MRRTLMPLAATLALLVAAAPAWSHATRTSSDPKEGARLRTAPEHLYVNLTEPPTADFQLTVTDGCGNDVVDFAEATQQTLHAILRPGQPGRWKVDFSVISGLDGHPTSDSYRFTVLGEADCSAQRSPAPDDGSDEEAGGDQPPSQGGSSFPWALTAIVAVGVIGAAAALRLRG